MSINLKSTQSCLDSLPYLLEVLGVALPDKKLIAVGWHYNDLEGLDKWVAFNVSTSATSTGLKYSLNSPLKIRELRHTIRSLQDTVNGLFTGANDFKVLYEGEGWQDVTFETDSNWKTIKLLPLFMKENIMITLTKFKKDSTINLKKESVDEWSKRKRFSRSSMVECLMIAANQSLKSGKSVYIASNYGGWHIFEELTDCDTINGYIEVNGYSATKYQPIYGDS